MTPDHLNPDRLQRPVFVVGSPRSGTTLLQNLLCRDPDVYKLGREGRFIWHRLGGQELTGVFPSPDRIAREYLSELYCGDRPWTDAEQRRWARRCASQGTPAQYLDLPHELLLELATGEEGPFAASVQTETAPFTLPPLDATWATETAGPVRMVDKDTGHCWRLPQLGKAFPDAKFIFVVREPLNVVRSLVAGWRHPTWFFTYRMDVDLRIGGYSDALPWGRRWWNFNLFPGWEQLVDARIEEVGARQWSAAIAAMAEHGLPLVDEGRAMVISFERIVEAPHAALGDIARFTDLNANAITAGGLDKAYMSMVPTRFDPGTGDIRRAVDQALAMLDPRAQSFTSS